MSEIPGAVAMGGVTEAGLRPPDCFADASFKGTLPDSWYSVPVDRLSGGFTFADNKLTASISREDANAAEQTPNWSLIKDYHTKVHGASDLIEEMAGFFSRVCYVDSKDVGILWQQVDVSDDNGLASDASLEVYAEKGAEAFVTEYFYDTEGQGLFVRNYDPTSQSCLDVSMRKAEPKDHVAFQDYLRRIAEAASQGRSNR